MVASMESASDWQPQHHSASRAASAEMLQRRIALIVSWDAKRRRKLLVDLIALVFRVANGNAQQRFRIQELQEAGGQGIGRVVNVGRPNGAVRSHQAEIRVRPVMRGTVQSAGEGLNVGVV